MQRQVNAGDRRVQVLERKRQQEESSVAKLREERKNEDEKLDEARDETAKERRLATSLKRENSASRRKREIYNGMAEFLTNPEMVDGSAIDDIIRTLEVARDLRKKPGHVGEAVKMTAEVRDRLLKRIAKGRFILKDKAEKRLEQELAKQQRKHDMKLKAKDTTIDAERRKRKAAERNLETIAPWRDEDMKKVKKENRQLRDRVLRLEGKNSDLKHELHHQRIMASS